ncbi:hypothetical protein ACHAXA_008018 [Cyclostephanos tholiformis]|uniref:Anamorsin homolog n=1 Tax=Cyclostephanos tholiformis TaxID=382380 RepID=A0ABD3R840_9STRA
MTAPAAVVIHVGSHVPAPPPPDDGGGGVDATTAFVVRAPTRESLPDCLVGIAASSSLHSIDVHVRASELSSHYDPLALASLVEYLRRDGIVYVHVVSNVGGRGGGDNDDDIDDVVDVDWGVVMTSFTLAGLRTESERRSSGERGCGGGGRVYTARRVQSTSVGATASVRLNLDGVVVDGNNGAKVTLNLDDDDDDRIDEDDLLLDAGDGMLAPPPPINVEARKAAAENDCGGRRACDNCSCGRAEREAATAEAEVYSGEEKKQEPHKSECGNCAKGDAFRCAGCPYLGKPAFKEGEEHLVLNLMDDV